MTANIKISLGVIAILFGLVGVKMYVNQEYNKIDAQIKERDMLQGEVRILKAELAYLNNIDRIDKLSAQYLSLNSVATKMIALNTDKNEANINNMEVKQRPSWRYKSRNYIMNIKHEVK